jgi:hypothetical protein
MLDGERPTLTKYLSIAPSCPWGKSPIRDDRLGDGRQDIVRHFLGRGFIGPAGELPGVPDPGQGQLFGVAHRGHVEPPRPVTRDRDHGGQIVFCATPRRVRTGRKMKL